ncbi:MAG: S41 family peptidase [candidate division Zixibacteria bacterium]|nr:S41 family peptidase [candidate division Zixibacteria bacterium]
MSTQYVNEARALLRGRAAARHSVAVVAVTLFILSVAAISGQAQQVIVTGQGEMPVVDAAMKAEIIDSLAAALNEAYVFPDVAKKMEELMRRQLKNKAYEKITRLDEFTQKLTEDMQSISHDGHLHVHPMLEAPGEPGDTLTDEERLKRAIEFGKYRNFGFVKVERLDGNIGYLELYQFADASFAGATAVAAMNFLANCDALIIDLRRNGGGEPSMIQLITSYFFNEPVHLNSFYIRRTDSTTQFWTQAFVEGPRMTDVPIYVLTSDYTFSGAEEFTYNLKNLKRATIIGETTGGGAHPVDFRRFFNLQVGMSLPFGRAVNPITGTNWEGTGVEPHIAVPADSALDVARMEALQTLFEKETNEDRKYHLDWILKGLKVMLDPVVLGVDGLRPFVGVYGPRKITLENGWLYYQREDRPKYRLTPMGQDMFLLEELDIFRIQFVRDESGAVSELIGLYDNGFRDSNERTGN